MYSGKTKTKFIKRVYVFDSECREWAFKFKINIIEVKCSPGRYVEKINLNSDCLKKWTEKTKPISITMRFIATSTVGTHDVVERFQSV